jgi:hypothetical protein
MSDAATFDNLPMLPGNSLAVPNDVSLDPPPDSPGKLWRDAVHAGLLDHPRLNPASMLDALADKMEQGDAVAVFAAIARTLPKESEQLATPQQFNHLMLVQLVNSAQQRGIDLGALLEAPADRPLDPPHAISSATVASPAAFDEGAGTPLPDWAR